jgi:hypothetical protein
MTNELHLAGFLLFGFCFAFFCLLVAMLGFGLAQQLCRQLIAAAPHQSHQRRQRHECRGRQQPDFPSLEVHPHMLPRFAKLRPGESHLPGQLGSGRFSSP